MTFSLSGPLLILTIILLPGVRDAWVLGSPFKHILLRVELGTGNNVSTYQCENYWSEGVLKSEYACCESG